MLRVAFPSIHVNWYTFLYVNKNAAIEPKIMGANAQNWVARHLRTFPTEFLNIKGLIHGKKNTITCRRGHHDEEIQMQVRHAILFS